MDPIQIIICALIVVAVAVITWFAAIAYRKNVAESKTGKAEDKAREIIDEALKTAEVRGDFENWSLGVGMRHEF